jgi:FkbM family methyltransferase
MGGIVGPNRGVMGGYAGGMSELSKAIRRVLGVSKRDRAAFPASWEERIELAVRCPDNRHIPRVEGAGEVRDGWMTMHNGLVVAADSYYDPKAMELMRQNRGVHEPQEERAFGAVLPLIRPDGVMVELGAYWCFYSMWFARQVGAGARCVCVEAEPANLEAGQGNVEQNRASNGIASRFDFVHAFAAKVDGRGEDGIERVSIPGLTRAHGLERIDLLHADVQGAERDVLEGAEAQLRTGLIRFAFVSTHTMNLHAECLRLFRRTGYHVAVDVSPRDSYSYDGVIVASAPGEERLAFPDMARRSRERRQAR